MNWPHTYRVRAKINENLFDVSIIHGHGIFD